MYSSSSSGLGSGPGLISGYGINNPPPLFTPAFTSTLPSSLPSITPLPPFPSSSFQSSFSSSTTTAPQAYPTIAATSYRPGSQTVPGMASIPAPNIGGASYFDGSYQSSPNKRNSLSGSKRESFSPTKPQVRFGSNTSNIGSVGQFGFNNRY